MFVVVPATLTETDFVAGDTNFGLRAFDCVVDADGMLIANLTLPWPLERPDCGAAGTAACDPPPPPHPARSNASTRAPEHLMDGRLNQLGEGSLSPWITPSLRRALA